MTIDPPIAVAMSGGVDSSTVAAMLRAQGNNVIGLTMQLAVIRSAQGYHELVANLPAECSMLGKAQMMRIRGHTAN